MKNESAPEGAASVQKLPRAAWILTGLFGLHALGVVADQGIDTAQAPGALISAIIAGAVSAWVVHGSALARIVVSVILGVISALVILGVSIHAGLATGALRFSPEWVRDLEGQGVEIVPSLLSAQGVVERGWDPVFLLSCALSLVWCVGSILVLWRFGRSEWVRKPESRRIGWTNDLLGLAILVGLFAFLQSMGIDESELSSGEPVAICQSEREECRSEEQARAWRD